MPAGRILWRPQQIRWLTTLEPGDAHDIRIRYQADGANSFAYGLSQDRRTNLLEVTIAVEGLVDSEVPQRSLPATAVEPAASPGETFVWRYDNLVANRDIHLALPQRLSFGQRVAALQDDFAVLGIIAPFLMLLFLGAVAVILRYEERSLEWLGYLLLGFGFLLFYPLLTFLSAFAGGFGAGLIAFSLVLVILAGFLWLMTGDRKIVWWSTWLLIIFLGVISLGVLLPFRGLLWVSGGVMLVGTFMVVYARRPSARRPLPPAETTILTGASMEPERELTAVAEPQPLAPEPVVMPEAAGRRRMIMLSALAAGMTAGPSGSVRIVATARWCPKADKPFTACIAVNHYNWGHVSTIHLSPVEPDGPRGSTRTDVGPAGIRAKPGGTAVLEGAGRQDPGAAGDGNGADISQRARHGGRV